MSLYSIFIVQPPGWTHMRLFREVADALAFSLKQLNHEVLYDPGDAPLIESPKPKKLSHGNKSFGRSIIIGAQFLPDIPLPLDAIIYNFEQVPDKLGTAPATVDAQLSDMWLRSPMLKLLRRHLVFDYSQTNIERLKRLGVENVRLCRVGFSSNLVGRIKRVEEEDIDVLFVGTVQTGSRRDQLLKAIAAQVVVEPDGVQRSIKVQTLSGVYGAERDAFISRAKIVLNVHNNPPEIAPAIFEIVRCSYYWMHSKCVVTEGAGQDSELEELAGRCSIIAPSIDVIPEFVAKLASEANRSVRFRVGESAFNEFRKIDQVAEVQRALGE